MQDHSQQLAAGSSGERRLLGRRGFWRRRRIRLSRGMFGSIATMARGWARGSRWGRNLGDEFVLLTAKTRRATKFTTETLPSLGTGKKSEVLYETAAVKLRVVAAP